MSVIMTARRLRYNGKRGPRGDDCDDQIEATPVRSSGPGDGEAVSGHKTRKDTSNPASSSRPCKKPKLTELPVEAVGDVSNVAHFGPQEIEENQIMQMARPRSCSEPMSI